jgi:four helix bundle protein
MASGLGPRASAGVAGHATRRGCGRKEGMSRDHNKLTVFGIADELVLHVYRLTKDLPAAERFGLQSQVRRAAVSVASNIVEGCARQSSKEYLNFLTIALGSASEARYLTSVCRRLEMCDSSGATRVEQRYSELIRGLQRLVDAVSRMRTTPIRRRG